MGGIVKEAKRGIRKVRKFLDQRAYSNPKLEKDIVTGFHRLYYDAAWIGMKRPSSFVEDDGVLPFSSRNLRP